mmetsp:Transcript_15215/g.26960  ORF Transcript_15215/g.26960 Transcript_15215/m.26960 type:complete len:128 (+) Transcript_15215:75-458(+)
MSALPLKVTAKPASKSLPSPLLVQGTLRTSVSTTLSAFLLLLLLLYRISWGLLASLSSGIQKHFRVGPWVTHGGPLDADNFCTLSFGMINCFLPVCSSWEIMQLQISQVAVYPSKQFAANQGQHRGH